MMWNVGAVLLVAMAGAGARGAAVGAPPCACPFILSRVCGSDGVTYDNDCMMKCLNANATVGYRGVCGRREPPPCVCDDTDSPVCGTNDRTYPNQCYLDCEKHSLPNLTLRHTGACKEKRSAEDKLCACPFISRPLCASDGRTYDSDCEMECHNPEAKVVYYGACGHREPPPCTCEYDNADSPVCGTNDRTYPNQCHLDCDKAVHPELTLAHKGACKQQRSVDPKACACPFISRPVCGSDGVTYDNDCMLKCRNPDAKLEYYGRCGNREVPCLCTDDYVPVCGTNDRTYPSECDLKCDQSIPDLSVKHTGVCKTKRDTEPKLCACPFISRPVCASDGLTYDTDCEMRCQSPDLQVIYEGPCREMPKRNAVAKVCSCPAVLLPVCGTDGVTYANDCILKCDNPNAKIKYDGPCKSKRNAGPQLCGCPPILREVCGTDGITYPNKCEMKCQNSFATVLSDGPCRSSADQPTGCACPAILREVCGTDGLTYPNQCEMKCQNPYTRVQSQGACRSKRSATDLSCLCIFESDPVCGSDGKTYGNPCMFNCEKLRAKQEGLHILHAGDCKAKSEGSESTTECICGYDLDEVCGSDGRTYGNPCSLECAKRTRPEVSQRHRGACKVSKRSIEKTD